jgi:tRNA modification GTPase
VLRLVDADTLVVLNKVDAAPNAQPIVAGHVWRVSVRTGDGMAKLVEAIAAETAKRLAAQDAAAPLITRARHRAALAECAAALERAHGLTVNGAAPELLAEDLRLAARALGKITGRVGVDDVLDIVFREFCIGK